MLLPSTSSLLISVRASEHRSACKAWSVQLNVSRRPVLYLGRADPRSPEDSCQERSSSGTACSCWTALRFCSDGVDCGTQLEVCKQMHQFSESSYAVIKNQHKPDIMPCTCNICIRQNKLNFFFFCTSYCLLHILLFCTFFLYLIAHFTLISPFLTICVMLLYIICIFILLHCPLSGPDSITFHF